jgi:hypothetical protein
MDKGGRRTEGRLQSKRARTTQALTSDKLCPFKFTIKWDFFGFYFTVEKKGFGCPITKITSRGASPNVPCQYNWIPERRMRFFDQCQMSDACIGAVVGQSDVFLSKLGNYITKAQIA